MGQLRVHNKMLRRQLLLPVDKLGRRQNGNTQKRVQPPLERMLQGTQ